MQVSAKLRYLNIAPRKVRLVADLIRGKSVEQAQTILNFTVKRGAKPLQKFLKSAIANAKNNFHLDESNLYVSKILVDEGPKFKRYMPRARGQAYEIQKKTSHITILLSEIEEKKRAKAKQKKKTKETVLTKETEEETEEPKVAEKLPKEDKFSRGEGKFKKTREAARPRIEKGLKRIFRRKSF